MEIVVSAALIDNSHEDDTQRTRCHDLAWSSSIYQLMICVSLNQHAYTHNTVSQLLNSCRRTGTQSINQFLLPRCMECRRGLAMRILSVCPSVCLSVTRVHCDRTVERSVKIYIPYERSFSLVFWEEQWLVGATPSTWNIGSTDPR